MSEQARRSFVKTVTWRLTGSLSTFIISLLISSDFAVAGTIAITQVIANTLLYYLHERVWNRISWGKF